MLCVLYCVQPVSAVSVALDDKKATLTPEEFDSARRELLIKLAPHFDHPGVKVSMCSFCL